MRTPFKDPVAAKSRKSSVDFASPTADEFKMAAGNGYGMGDDYGTGLPAKIGSYGKSSSDPIPKGSMKIPPKALG